MPQVATALTSAIADDSGGIRCSDQHPDLPSLRRGPVDNEMTQHLVQRILARRVFEIAQDADQSRGRSAAEA